MFDQPSGHQRIRFVVGQRVKQSLACTSFVELPERVGADLVVGLEQPRQITGRQVRRGSSTVRCVASWYSDAMIR
jgi:hypothetical protein